VHINGEYFNRCSSAQAAEHPVAAAAAKPDQALVTMAQLTHLHARVEALEVSELLSEVESFALLDSVANVIELRQTWLVQGRRRVHDTEFELVATVCTMVRLAEAIETDKQLARQFRRKFVSK
jgi:hypothetical protein